MRQLLIDDGVPSARIDVRAMGGADDKGQPVTTNIAVTVSSPKLDEKGQPVMANGVAVMVDVPQMDAKGQPLVCASRRG